MTPQTAHNVEAAHGGRKRKSGRGTIRERTWKDTSGKPHSAWQADFGEVNGKRLMRSFPTKADSENWLRQQALAPILPPLPLSLKCLIR